MNDFYRQYLDAAPHREGTNSLKWDARERVFGRADVIPLWVADMDFPTVPAVHEAIVERAKHPLYGYTIHNADEKQAEIAWSERRFGVHLEPDWIFQSPGVVDSMIFVLRALGKPGDSVIIQPPVYGPFFDSVDKAGLKQRHNNLIETPEGWRMDYADLEAALREGARLMLLCNPHNPIGRIWTAEELQRAFDLAARYDCTVVVDEIHADFVLPGGKPSRSYALDHTDNLVVLESATKSFNLAGMRNSSVVVKNPALRERIQKEFNAVDASSPNLFGPLAQKTAFETGDEWMDAVCEYIGENRDFAEKYIAECLPEIKFHHLEGTYLMWLDFSSLGLEQDALVRFLVDEAGVGLGNGLGFGEAGRGHMRLNLGTQRRNVEQGLKNIREALDRRKS